jgi:hypothetical protein
MRFIIVHLVTRRFRGENPCGDTARLRRGRIVWSLRRGKQPTPRLTSK